MQRFLSIALAMCLSLGLTMSFDAEAKRIHNEGMVTVGHMREQIAAEREACANLLDSTDLSAMSADPKLQNWTAALLFQYAAAIRARGNT